MTEPTPAPAAPSTNASAGAVQDGADRAAALRTRAAAHLDHLADVHAWTSLLHVAAAFPLQPLDNLLLIHATRPAATHLETYTGWQRHGRQVAKGERGLPLLHSQHPNRVSFVWDLTQTTGDGTPAAPAEADPLQLWTSLVSHAAASGYGLERGAVPNGPVHVDAAQRSIVVSDQLDAVDANAVASHEVAHLVLHSRPCAPPTCDGPSRLEADAVAVLVVGDVGAASVRAPGDEAVAVVINKLPGDQRSDLLRATLERALTVAAQLRTPVVSPPAGATRQRQPRRRAHTGRTHDDARPKRRRRTGTPSTSELLELHTMAHAFYRAHLPASWVPAYLDERSLGVALDQPWQVGYAPPGWTRLVDHLAAEGADDDLLRASGLATVARTGRLVDRFRDRAMIPLRDPDGGAVIAFTGRAHPADSDDRNPRYLNSPETPLYRKGSHLHGLAEGRALLSLGARAVLVEGPFDAIAVTSSTGGRCVGLAACGTAITADHLDRLTRHAEPDRGLVVAFDDDPAGRDAAERLNVAALTRGWLPVAAALPSGADPAATVQLHGPAALTSALLDQARPLIDVVIDRRIAARADQLRWVEGRLAALRDVAPLVAALPPGHAALRANHLARVLDLDPITVHREIGARVGKPPPAGRSSCSTAVGRRDARTTATVRSR